MRNPFRPFVTQLAQSPDGRLHAALELISGIVTAPGATLTDLTMSSTDSKTVRQAASAKRISLLNFWTVNKVAGAALIKSIRMHDAQQGIRALTTTTSFAPSMPMGWQEPLISQDTLTMQLSGSAVGGAIEQMSALIYYDSLDSSNGRFISPADLKTKGGKMMTVRTTHAFGATGTYSGQVAINSTDDNGANGADYALLGYKVSALCGAIAYRGLDTGNVRIGGPGFVANPQLTENWFVFLSDQTGLPLIPVFNWANKSGIFVDGTQDDGAAAVTCTSYLVRLN